MDSTVAKSKAPSTAAIRALKAASLRFEVHTYDYIDRGGTRASSSALGVDEYLVIKTLVLETEAGQGLIALMHGTHLVSTKAIARHLGTKKVSPCSTQDAEKHSGYLVGGTSPFGLRSALPIFAQESIFDLEEAFINGGKRGLLVKLATADIKSTLSPTLLEMRA